MFTTIPLHVNIYRRYIDMEGVFWTLHTSKMLYNKHFFIAPALFSLLISNINKQIQKLYLILLRQRFANPNWTGDITKSNTDVIF